MKMRSAVKLQKQANKIVRLRAKQEPNELGNQKTT